MNFKYNFFNQFRNLIKLIKLTQRNFFFILSISIKLFTGIVR